MEIIVVTLAHTTPGRDADGLARIRFISDTVRNIHGLVTSSFYRSRGNESYYLMLTTWEDEDTWRKVREQYSPKQLLLGSATDLLTGPPEQWLMHYLWGYSRPAAVAMLAAAHLATIRPDQVERTQRGWVESLRRQAVQPNLSFAFLARGENEDTRLDQSPAISSNPEARETPWARGAIFLNLLSWSSDADREDFYADPNYQAISRFLSSVGVMQILPLDPL